MHFQYVKKFNQYVKLKKKYNPSYKTKISVLYSYYYSCFSKPKHRNRTVLEKAQELHRAI